MEANTEGIWVFDSGTRGPSVCISFGVHGNERPPIEAGLALLRALETGERSLQAGKLLVIHGNPRASDEDARFSQGGIDLNRCFHRDVLGRAPESFEETRATEIVTALEKHETQILVDFHCTVEPGPRFLLQHPPVENTAHRAVFDLLQAEVLLSDPDLNFGSVSLDEWMSTRDRVGICYETGWIRDPANTAEYVLGEMNNILVGLGMLAGEPSRYLDKKLLQLEGTLICTGEGFQWLEGIGINLQELPAGTHLGNYAGGAEVLLEDDMTLVFPKKKPELVEQGQPLVYVAKLMS